MAIISTRLGGLDDVNHEAEGPNLNDVKPILIIGAGPVGLAIAQGLKQKHIDFRIYEKASELRQTGWAVTLNPQGIQHLCSLLPEELRDLSSLGVIDPVEDDHQLLHFDGSTGKPAFKRTPFHRIRADRGALCRHLACGLEINFCHEPSDFKYDDKNVEVRFTNGKIVIGSCVIGADGALSAVREAICARGTAERTSLPVKALGLTIHLREDQAAELFKLHNLIISASHPRQGVFIYISRLKQLGKDGTPCYPIQICQSWRTDVEGSANDIPGTNEWDTRRIDLLSSQIRDWAAPFNKLYDAAYRLGSAVHEVKMTEWSPAPWDSKQGRVTLVGDAAHQFPPYRGEAINHGFVDATVLVRQLTACFPPANDSAYELNQAITDYETLMRPRAIRAVELSRQATLDAHEWSKLDAGPLYGQTWDQRTCWFGEEKGIDLREERISGEREGDEGYTEGPPATEQVEKEIELQSAACASMGPI